ncbi:MAG: hypothetical protein OXB95_05715 [Rhodobacteraceae bacterium]|nr:hypothetical protein [Paracoccaceae bacterium]
MARSRLLLMSSFACRETGGGLAAAGRRECMVATKAMLELPRQLPSCGCRSQSEVETGMGLVEMHGCTG